MSVLLENGIYDAVFNGQASVYESTAGNLTVCFEVLVGDVVRKAFCALFMKKGTEINERQIEKLAAIFPDWNKDDPSWFLEPENIKDKQCEVRIENDTDANGQTWSNVKDIAAVGKSTEAGYGEGMPASMDKKALQAKYGAKFRAAAAKTGQPIKPSGGNGKKNKAEKEIPADPAGAEG